MAKGDILVGLDIGTTKVCTIVAEAGEMPGLVNILGVGSAPSTGIRRGVVSDMDSTVAAIRQSVAEAQKAAGAEINSVVVGVTGEHIASLNSRGVIAVTHADREVRREDVERVLENARVIVLPPDREIIHVIARGYSLDGQKGIQNPVGMYGTRLEVETHIVTGATTFLQNVARCVERAGLMVEDTVLEPVATAMAVVLPTERNLGVALLDIGGGTSDLALFVDGEICHSAVIPVGGQYVTKDIAMGLRTTLDEAERVKLEYASACFLPEDETKTFTFTGLNCEESTTLPMEVLTEIVEPRMTELFQMVRQEINRSNYASLMATGLVVSGGGARLRGTLRSASEIVGMPARLGAPAGVGGHSESVNAPSFSTGVGLVQWASRTHSESQPLENSPTTFFGAVGDWMRRVFGGIFAQS